MPNTLLLRDHDGNLYIPGSVFGRDLLCGINPNGTLVVDAVMAVGILAHLHNDAAARRWKELKSTHPRLCLDLHDTELSFHFQLFGQRDVVSLRVGFLKLIDILDSRSSGFYPIQPAQLSYCSVTLKPEPIRPSSGSRLNVASFFPSGKYTMW